jgi:hypothetical protein
MSKRRHSSNSYYPLQRNPEKTKEMSMKMKRRKGYQLDLFIEIKKIKKIKKIKPGVTQDPQVGYSNIL